jgi:hypothetical protein
MLWFGHVFIFLMMNGIPVIDLGQAIEQARSLAPDGIIDLSPDAVRLQTVQPRPEFPDARRKSRVNRRLNSGYCGM